MAKRVQFIRHLAAAADAFVGLVGEITVNLTNSALRVHDGATPGGHELARIDASNMQAATAAQDGKLTAAKFQEVEAATAALAGHVGVGGSVHPNAVPAGAAGFMSGNDKSKLDSIEAGASGDLTAGEILALLLGVDGSGSGLDADLLDGAGPAESAAGSTIAKRDANGQLTVATPTSDDKAANKGYVDDGIEALGAVAALVTTEIIAGAGLAGGGDLSTDRTLQMEIGNFTEITTPAANDWVPIKDSSDSGNNRKIQVSNFLKPVDKVVADLSAGSPTEHIITGLENTRRITGSINNLSLSGTDEFHLELGTAASFIQAGYDGSSYDHNAGGAFYDAGVAFRLLVDANAALAAADVWRIEFILTRVSKTSNVWNLFGQAHLLTSTKVRQIDGQVVLPAALTRVKFKSSVSNTFDATGGGGSLYLTAELG